MAVTTERHFEWFKQCIEKWMRICFLGDWDVYFEHVYCDNYFARVSINTRDNIMAFKLNTEWPTLLPLNKQSIDNVACHEVSHIRTSRLCDLAYSRYVREEEIDKADEELVIWITKILKNRR